MKKSTLKKLLVSSAVLGLTTGLALTSTSQDTVQAAGKKTTVKLWVGSNAKKSYVGTIKAFEKENPGVKVKIIETDDSKTQETLKKDPSKGADVLSLPHDQLGQLVESGIIQELPEKYTKEVKSTQTDQAIAGAQYKDKTYAFPYGIESLVLYYNKSKLSAEDVKSYETITSKGKFGGSFKEMDAYYTAPIFMTAGAHLFGPEGEDVKGTNWGSDAGVNALKWISAQKSNPNFVQADAGSIISEFGKGKFDAVELGPWNYDAVKEAIGEKNVGIATYPTINIAGKDVQQKAFLGVKLYAVNQAPAGGNTKRIAASYKLAAYMTNAKTQESSFKAEDRRVIPSNKEVQNADYVKSNELAQAIIKMGSSSDYTVVMPKLSQMSVFWPESAAILSDTYNGKLKESSYLKRLQQFDKDIAKAK